MDSILKNINEYYTNKINQFGNTPRGVDWKDEQSQFIRFDQLLKVIEDKSDFSVNDLGCGFGSMFLYMLQNTFGKFNYNGYDLSAEMIEHANEVCGEFNGLSFFKVNASSEMQVADYSVASGIFNVKMNHNDQEWLTYITDALHDLNEKSTKGFSFNALTLFSDAEFKKEHLYYADPMFLFEHCKKNYSRNVALLHDYNLFEFTIIVRK